MVQWDSQDGSLNVFDFWFYDFNCYIIIIINLFINFYVYSLNIY